MEVRSDSALDDATGRRILLITHNVTGLFDAVDDVLDQWILELTELVVQHSSDFVALHLQEVGGSNWQTGGLSHSVLIIAAVRKAFSDFWCSGLICNPDVNNSFSALGCIYLVGCKPPVMCVRACLGICLSACHLRGQ